MMTTNLDALDALDLAHTQKRHPDNFPRDTMEIAIGGKRRRTENRAEVTEYPHGRQLRRLEIQHRPIETLEYPKVDSANDFEVPRRGCGWNVTADRDALNCDSATTDGAAYIRFEAADTTDGLHPQAEINAKHRHRLNGVDKTTSTRFRLSSMDKNVLQPGVATRNVGHYIRRSIDIGEDGGRTINVVIDDNQVEVHVRTSDNPFLATTKIDLDGNVTASRTLPGQRQHVMMTEGGRICVDQCGQGYMPPFDRRYIVRKDGVVEQHEWKLTAAQIAPPMRPQTNTNK